MFDWKKWDNRDIPCGNEGHTQSDYDDHYVCGKCFEEIERLARLGAAVEGMGTGTEIARNCSDKWTAAVHDGVNWLQCVDDAGETQWATPLEAVAAIYTYKTT